MKIVPSIIVALSVVLGGWLAGRGFDSGASRIAESIENQGRYSFWSSEEGWMRIFDTRTGKVHVPSGGIWSELPLNGELQKTDKSSGVTDE